MIVVVVVALAVPGVCGAVVVCVVGVDVVVFVANVAFVCGGVLLAFVCVCCCVCVGGVIVAMCWSVVKDVVDMCGLGLLFVLHSCLVTL